MGRCGIQPGAKNLAEIVELQTAYWRKQFSALTAEAEEVRALSTKVTADAGEPLQAHVKRGVDELGNRSSPGEVSQALKRS